MRAVHAEDQDHYTTKRSVRSGACLALCLYGIGFLTCLAALALFNPIIGLFGILFGLIGDRIRRRQHLCGACGNPVAATSQLCPACGSIFGISPDEHEAREVERAANRQSWITAWTYTAAIFACILAGLALVAWILTLKR